jgi:hypothetical protein
VGGLLLLKSLKCVGEEHKQIHVGKITLTTKQKINYTEKHVERGNSQKKNI